MYKIAIIGTGQLGSRHLQGVKTANLELSIEVVDSNINSLIIAKNRYNEIEENEFSKNVLYLSSINELSYDLDLVIIATSSGPRFEIASELIKKRKVRNILFEKVLFQKVEYFYEINNLLINNNIKAWVNCPRRMYDYFNIIKKEFDNEEKLMFIVTGGEWGLGCNSIHFIDIFSYLTKQTNYSLLTEGLNKKLYPSKRSGYVEFCGILSGRTERGDIFNFISQENSSSTPLMTIVSLNKKFVIDESKAFLVSLVNNNWTTSKITVPYQSCLTGNLIEDILLYNNSLLTEYEESMKLHLPFVSSILDFYNKITGNITNICPIT